MPACRPRSAEAKIPNQQHKETDTSRPSMPEESREQIGVWTHLRLVRKSANHTPQNDHRGGRRIYHSFGVRRNCRSDLRKLLIFFCRELGRNPGTVSSTSSDDYITPHRPHRLNAGLSRERTKQRETKTKMPRQRRGVATAPARPTAAPPAPARPAPQQTAPHSTAAHPPAPAPQPQQVPVQQQSSGPGLFSQMASTAA